MNYLLVLYAGNRIYELELSQGSSATIGTRENDTLRLDQPELKPSHWTVTALETGIHVLSRTFIQVDGKNTVNRVLSVGDVAQLTEKLSMSILEKRCDVHDAISLRRLNEVALGRHGDNDIRMNGPQVSSLHAALRRTRDGWVIEDLGSRNGTYVEGKSVNSAILEDGIPVFIGGFEFFLRGDLLHFKNTSGSVMFSSNLEHVNVRAMTKMVRYPFFQRSPRLKPETEQLEVEVLSPPSRGSKPSVSWFSILLPPVMMATVMIGVASITRNVMTLYYTVPMSAVSVIVSIVNYNLQMKKWKQIQRRAEEKYAAHLKEREDVITAAESNFLQTLSAVNPGVRECAAIAERLERRLWERTVWDEDFLEIRLGTGQSSSNVKVKIPQAQLSIEEDPLLEEAKKLKEKHAVLTGVPVKHSFLLSTITGLAGNRSAIQKTAWTIVMSLAAHHSYEDVKIVCLYPKSEKRAWEWIRWLPHVWNTARTKRFLACTSEDARSLIRDFAETLKVRRRNVEERVGRDVKPETPFYFLLLADKNLVEDSGEQILPEDPALGMTTVYAYGGMELLPGECEAVIHCDEPKCSLQLKSSAGNRVPFTAERISLDLVDAFARSLAPVRLRSGVAATTMPMYITFLQGYEVNRVEELDVLGRWARSQPFKSLAAPIGIRENGEVFYFDIHEKGMGPHGIVAGATRWGKSETLTTWLLSVALNFNPHEVSFVLIDFKGDGLSGILMDLPHVAGVISNVDDITSIERNLRSLHGELLRRQRVFKETQLENIHKYQEAYRKGRAPAPMPYLIIVIDEFAELKTQFPDQMNEFISIARVGGSLGVYMVLATQSPGGIVAGQVSANSRFRICLKTAEAGESKEILGTTDAFRITVRGRAYVKVGNNEVYEQVQTFYSKAPYQPNAEEKGPITEISIVETNGERTRPEVYDKTLRAMDSELGEGRAVSHYIRETVRENNIANARPVWTEALPKHLFLSDLLVGREAFRNGVWRTCNGNLSVVAGRVDDPEGQCQYPLILNFAKDGHQILYGAPSSGKTTFLQTVLLSAALSYTPLQVQFLVLDFGTWGMKIFEGLPHTLLVADSNDADKVKKAEEYLLSELASRKQRFAEQGVGTLDAYREVTGEQVPALLIVVDNMASLYNRYPDFLDSLIDLAREGGGLGLYLLLTAGNAGSFIFRIAQYVKVSYALQLTDRTDYRALVGGNGRQEPGHFPGRGFTKGPLEFQTALCVEGASEGERVKQLRAICTAMSEAWEGSRAELRTAPKEIDADTLTFDKNHVQIGFEKQTARPFDFVFEEMHGCVISGTPGSGKTNILGLLVRALREDPDTRIYIYEKAYVLENIASEALSGSLTASAAHDGVIFDAFLFNIAEEYDRRSKEDPSASRSRIVLCIDDFSDFYGEISNEGADLFDRIVRCGKDYGIYVYIAGDKGGLARLHSFLIKSFESCLSNGNAIALGGRLKDCEFFDALHQEDDVVFPGGEGCVIHGGKVQRFKLAKVKGQAEAHEEMASA
ncbi:MAG: type VII secretion protein EssC [Synergistaceae bacterium]|jgi:S-DNA-T family DNA segregation ATPase FtsK/SpoIIIE|nr:type VII secretion protein EssC [Synergistaceae bacterium]